MISQRKSLLDCMKNNKRSIAKLNEARKTSYERLINASVQPISVPWIMPDSIDFYLPEDSVKFEQHLYCNEDGTFQTTLNKWESGLLDEELKNGAILLLCNLDRKSGPLKFHMKLTVSPLLCSQIW